MVMTVVAFLSFLVLVLLLVSLTEPLARKEKEEL